MISVKNVVRKNWWTKAERISVVNKCIFQVYMVYGMGGSVNRYKGLWEQLLKQRLCFGIISVICIFIF